MEIPTFRQRLALRLEGFPLLRTLVLDTAFFWAFCLVLAAVLALAVAAPKVWRTTPRGFSRASIKVSLIDLAQAWSLTRSARKAQAHGDFERAILALRGALVNNLGDPRSHRAVLSLLLEAPEARPEHSILVLFSTSWLLPLGRTNLADLELAADTLEKYSLSAYSLVTLESAVHGNDPALAGVRARSLFAGGRVEEFLALWRTHESAWKSDPRMRLYHDAWVAGWSTGVPAIDALQRLRAATREEGNPGLTASRLLLKAGVRRGGPDDVAIAIERLEKAHSASILQQATYWGFLASVGRLDEAREKALAYREQPRLASDAAEYGAALAALGLRDEAIKYLEDNLGHFQTQAAIWQAYLSILLDARRWNDIRRAVANVQTQAASFETTRILALFAQYRAEVAEGRDYTADDFARQLASARILDNGTALTVARALTRDHRADSALEILRGKRADLADETVYWKEVFSAALEARNLETLREASIELLRLTPNDPVALSNRAAILIALGEEPLEALEITFRLVMDFPKAPAFRINHAFSLMLNKRTDEAWEMLRQLDPTRLDRQAASAFHFAMAEVLSARGDFSGALAEAEKVQPGMILPPQVERLTQLRRELRTKTGS